MSATAVYRSRSPTSPLLFDSLEGTQNRFTPTGFLNTLFQSREQIQTAVKLLRSDRLFVTTELKSFLNEAMNQRKLEHPLYDLLKLILDGNEHNLEARTSVAKDYIEKYLEDKQFELHYAYLKEPHVLPAHLLIAAKASGINAQNQRQARIDKVMSQEKVTYTLLCSHEVELLFEEVAIVAKKTLTLLNESQYANLITPIVNRN